MDSNSAQQGTHKRTSRWQMGLAIIMLLVSLGGVYVMVRNSIDLEQIFNIEMRDQFNSIIEASDLQRELMQTRIAVKESLLTPEDSSGLIAQRYAFARLRYLDMLLRIQESRDSDIYSPYSTEILRAMEPAFETTSQLIVELQKTDDLTRRISILQELDTHLESLARSSGEIFIEQGAMERVLITDTRQVISDSQLLLAMAGVVLVCISGILMIISRWTLRVETTANERFRLAASAVSSAIYDWDITVDLFSWTDGLTDAFGYPLESVQPNLEWLLEHIHPDDQERIRRQVNEDVATGHDFIAEYRFRHYDDHYVDVLNRGRMLLNSTGQGIRMVGSMDDISERKMALLYEEASRFKSQLVASVSHDLRTPLNAIIGYTEILQEDLNDVYPEAREQFQITKRILVSTRILADLIENLLEQTRIESGEGGLEEQLFSPANLLQSVVIAMSGIIEQKGLSLTTTIASDLPVALYGDVKRLRQVLLNLTGNAAKFTDSGEICISVYRPDETHWAFRVSDTGVGISLEDQRHIFDAFRRADNLTTREQVGSGLGLSIVKQIIDMMQGKVSLDSTPDQGSAFTVVLPLQSVPEVVPQSNTAVRKDV